MSWHDYDEAEQLCQEVKELREMNAELLDALKIAREYVASVDGTMGGGIDCVDTVVTPDLRKADQAIAKAEELK